MLVIFILMITGAALYKLKIFTEEGSAQATKILLNLVMPCVIINAYQTEYNAEIIKSLFAATLLSMAVHIIAIALSSVIFRKKNNRRAVNIFSAVYSNCGFMGFPLLTAIFGSEGVFYGSAYFTVFTILSWTHGISVFDKEKSRFNIKQIIMNPGVIGVVLGLIIFFLRLKLPYIVSESINYISMLNTPLAMLVLGTHMAKIRIKDITDKLNLTAVTLIKLVIIPVLGVILSRVFGITGDVTGAVIVSAACPTAAMATLFASKYGSDATYATVTVVVTTILSVITIPLLTTLI